MLPTPLKQGQREYLDTPGQNPADLQGLLQAIRRTNRWFGGDRLIFWYLAQFASRILTQPLTILDVATASADVPRAIAKWAHQHKLLVRITALDISEDILAFARRDLGSHESIALVRANAITLPFRARAFDVVISSLALHHFSDEEAIMVLQEIDRVAGGGFIVSDILRSWGALAGAWLDTRLLARNRLARHDGPLSVLRAYTLQELHRLSEVAALRNVEIRRHPVFRAALVRWPK